jgi:hypothetical protein
MKFEFFRHMFEKSSNTRLHENPSSVSRVVRCGQTNGRTDRHDKAKSRFRFFAERPVSELNLWFESTATTNSLVCAKITRYVTHSLKNSK